LIRVRWTSPAAADLEQISSDLNEQHPHLTHSTISTIYDEVLSLKLSPHRGRPGRRSQTRELVLAPLPYIVVYRTIMFGANPRVVEILHIHHGARWRP
jgi:toxin ParE1/3/4